MATHPYFLTKGSPVRCIRYPAKPHVAVSTRPKGETRWAADMSCHRKTVRMRKGT